ncbi:MAG: acyl dehydratase [Chromatiales bacterium]|nr:acyl dehydratase [Chromatiales bacterium]
MADRWYEDFNVRDVLVTATGALSEADIIEFARLYDPQPFHVDAIAAQRSAYGGIIASGWQLAAFAFRLFMDTRPFAPEASLGSPGVQDLSWVRPVRPNQRLHVEIEVTAKRESASKPDRGLVTLEWRVLDDDEQLMASMRSIQLLRLRAREA